MAEKEKKQTGKKRNYKPKHQFYEVKGDAVERKNKSCPKCGPAVFLAVHSDRVSCGGCGFTEKTGAPSSGAPKEEKSENRELKTENQESKPEGEKAGEPKSEKKELQAEPKDKKEETPVEKKD